MVSGRRRSAVAGPFSLSTTFAFLILVSPPSVIGGGGVVGHGRLGREIDQFLDLEFRVTLKTFVCEEFDHFVKGKGALYVAFRTGGLDRVIGSFRDAVQEPVDTLFFGRGVKGVVVVHLSYQFFEQVDVFGDIGAMNVAKVFNGVSECFPSLF